MEKIFSVLGTFFLFLFGDFDFLLKAILTLMLLDYITGVCKSFVKKKVNSSIGAKGIIKKVIYLCIIAVSVILDKMLNTNGGLRTLVITSFIFNEILSILENSSEMGIKIPKVIYNSLEKLKQKDEN
jgi:toxin secretion/phage lysis holin